MPDIQFGVASLGVSAGTQETSRFPRGFLSASDLPQKRLVIRKGERCAEAWQSAGRSEAGRIALLNNMTIVGNTASGIYNRATATMQNTIMPKNPTLSAPDCDTQLGDR